MEEEPIKIKCTKCKCNRLPADFLKNGRTLKNCLPCRTFSNKYHSRRQYFNSKEEQIYYKGIGSQQKCFDNGDKKGHKFFISYQQKLGDNWSNTYTSFNNIQDFLDYQAMLDPKECRFYEIIRSVCPEYYDLDFRLDYWKGDTTIEKIELVIDEFIKMRNEFSYKNTINNMTYKKEDLIVLEACGNGKLSLHVIIRPEINGRSKRYFVTCSQQKIFSKIFGDFLREQDSDITLDLSVYNTNSLMRLKGSHKGDEVGRKFKSYTKNITDENLFFCSHVGEEKGDFPFTPIVKKTVKEIGCLESHLSNNEHKILFDHINVCRWDDYDTCLSLIWLGKKLKLTDADIHTYCHKSKKYSFEWVQQTIDRRKEECPFGMGTLIYYLKKDVSSDVLSLIIPNNLDNTYQGIKDITSSRRTPEQKAYLIRVDNKIIKRQIESLFTYNENTFIKIKTISDDIPFVQNIVFPEGFRCIGIHAGLGRGKTQSLIRLVKSMPVDYKVLILSPRITFSTNICAEYNSELPPDNQFHCYITYKKKGKSLSKLSSHNKIVCSMESIHYLKNYTPDLLIVDEVNANLISSCSTETNGINMDNNIYEFHRLLNNSPRVVVADAFLGSKVCNYFFDLKIPLFVYKYLCKPKELSAVFLGNVDKEVQKALKAKYSAEEYDRKKVLVHSFFTKIQNLLKEKKKVYSFISARKSLEILQEEIQEDYKCEFYSGHSQNEIPDDLNILWNTKDLVATTSTITVGVSHTTDHFDTKVIYFQSSSRNYISDAIQSHFRVRHIKDEKIYIEVEEPTIFVNMPVNMKMFEESLNHKAMAMNKLYAGYSNLPMYMRNLVSHNYLEHSLSKQVPTKMMKRYLTECNYQINFETEKVEKEDRDLNDESIKKVYEHEIIRELVEGFPNAPRIVELEKQKQKRKLTSSERIEIDRFWFFNMYTGGTPAGYRDTNIYTVALAYQIWKFQFHGKSVIREMRLEKKVMEGKITIKELAEQKWEKTQFAELQKREIIKIERIISVCKILGLKHCNDTETEIPQEKMNDFYTEAQDEYDNIRKDMDIRDQRVFKSNKPTATQIAGLCKSVFTATDHSMCNLEVVNEKQVTQDGKRIRVRSYGLVPNKNIQEQVIKFNLENKDYQINDENIPLTLYNNLRTTGRDTLEEKK